MLHAKYGQLGSHMAAHGDQECSCLPASASHLQLALCLLQSSSQSLYGMCSHCSFTSTGLSDFLSNAHALIID